MTKSITRLRLRRYRRTSSSFNHILFTYVILACTSAAFSSPPSCGLYGAPPCQFLPAPPGQTPNCARPGKTYCEHVDNYPTYLIKSLVRKWGYEAATLLVDETWEEFTSITSVFYDPRYIFPKRDYPYGQDFNGYNYNTPHGGVPHRSTAGNPLFAPNSPTTERPPYLLYTSAGQQGGGNQQQQQSTVGLSPPAVMQLYYNNAGRTPYNATLWLKRLVRDLSLKQKDTQAIVEQLQQQQLTELAGEALQQELQEKEKEREKEEQLEKEEELEEAKKDEQENEQQLRSTRDVSLNMDLLDIVGVSNTDNNNNNDGGKKKVSRTKRQSSGRSTLCETTSQFITPQAALNSRGNWMFVVNEENTARQMVKAELCASNTCSNLCDLPNGYNSRCEQKYVQKRLIALQGNGQNLYTDTFWFPSCCVCTIAAN